jgi:lysocardiolipin and lysophospholipid acyltransferase
LHERWAEKDALMEAYLSTGRFPSSPLATEKGQGTYIETEVKTRYPFEWAQIFAVVGVTGLLFNNALKIWHRLFG